MMRCWIYGLALLALLPAGMRAADDARQASDAAANTTTARAETEPAAAEIPAPKVVTTKGNLVIIGGALRFTDTSVWAQIVELSGGPGARIAVFPTASSSPMASGERIAKVLEAAGARPFVVPLGVMNIDQDYQKVAADPEWAAKVKSSGGVFFSGGSQSRITQALLNKDGGKTPLLEAVWDVYHRGGVVAGTSAGAAMMSETMFANPSTVLGTLQKGVRMGAEIDRGLGFLGGSWFVEQHCLVRGRFARALVAMHTAGIKYGVGIDEDTAVVVRNGKRLTVCGYKGCLVFDVSEAKQDDQIKGFNLQNVKMSYLDRGDSIDLNTLEIIPHELKKVNPKIDPQAEGFKPWWKKPIVTNDILGNAVISTVMSQVLTHEKGEATGLAYDGAAARGGETSGFEFRLYRAPDTCGWFTDDEGYDAFTVSNVRLDVEPVMLTAPTYSYLKPKGDVKGDAKDDAATQTAVITPVGAQTPADGMPVVKPASDTTVSAKASTSDKPVSEPAAQE